MIGTIQDITERKQIEATLQDSIVQFRTLFEASPDAIMLIEPKDDWIILDCNTVACQMNGYERDELIGQSINILNSAVVVPNERQEYMERIKKNNILHYETTHRHKDGSVFPVEVSTSLIKLGDRDLILGIDRDITERKQAETLLQESQAQFSSVLEYAPIGMALVAPDGHWLRANNALSKLIGYTEEELLEMTFQDITHPDDLDKDLTYVNQMLTGRINFYKMEKRYFHKSGSYRMGFIKRFSSAG